MSEENLAPRCYYCGDRADDFYIGKIKEPICKWCTGEIYRCVGLRKNPMKTKKKSGAQDDESQSHQ